MPDRPDGSPDGNLHEHNDSSRPPPEGSQRPPPERDSSPPPPEGDSSPPPPGNKQNEKPAEGGMLAIIIFAVYLNLFIISFSRLYTV